MPSFTPPVGYDIPSVLPETSGPQRALFRYYGPWPRGRSVLFRSGHYVTVINPTQDDLAGLTDGVTYFLGGHTYTVDSAIGALLTADGYTVT